MATNLEFHLPPPLNGLNCLIISGITRINIVQLEYLTKDSHQVPLERGATDVPQEVMHYIAPYPEQIRMTR